jgi:hypothetical protein
VADGQHHPLDPRVIPLDQLVGTLVVLAIGLGSLIGLGIFVLVADDLPVWVRALPFLAWLGLSMAAVWHARTWPRRAYQHASYRVDEQGIEIRRGVYWRVVINVPKSRVQHIDVTQGPLGRRHGLGTLVIYTAGTDYAKVELHGLEHGRALEIRQHLMPSGTSDAI